MTTHKRWNHGGKALQAKYICQKCGYTAQQKVYLKDHINVVHLKEKHYKCDQCNYTSGYYNNMSLHKKIHQPDDIGRNGLLEDH